MNLLKAFVVSMVLIPAGWVFAQDQQQPVVPAAMVQQEISFSYFNFNAYYSCSYVESVAYAQLEQLGAQDISVDCQGGLPETNGNWVTATFSAVRETTAEKSTRTARKFGEELNIRESCDLQDTVFREVSRGFDVSNVNRSGSCWDSAGSLRYSLQVLR